ICVRPIAGRCLEDLRNLHRNPANERVSRLLCPSTTSWLDHTTAAFGDVAPGSLDLGLELVSKFQLVFQNVIEPIAKRLLFGDWQLLHLLLDLFKRRHNSIKRYQSINRKA